MHTMFRIEIRKVIGLAGMIVLSPLQEHTQPLLAEEPLNFATASLPALQDLQYTSIVLAAGEMHF